MREFELAVYDQIRTEVQQNVPERCQRCPDLGIIGVRAAVKIARDVTEGRLGLELALAEAREEAERATAHCDGPIVQDDPGCFGPDAICGEMMTSEHILRSVN